MACIQGDVPFDGDVTLALAEFHSLRHLSTPIACIISLKYILASKYCTKGEPNGVLARRSFAATLGWAAFTEIED
jgi:hypothetical protein